MVLGILRVGVDLSLIDELKPGLFCKADDFGLGNIPHFRPFLANHVLFAAVRYETEDATGFKRLVHRGKHLVGAVVVQPVMDIAEGQHHVRLPLRLQFRLVRRRKFKHDDLAIYVRFSRQFIGIFFVAAAVVLYLGFAVVAPYVECPAVPQVWRQDFRIPATRAGGDLNHRQVGADTEPGQGFSRVAVLVARLVGVGAMVAICNRRKLIGVFIGDGVKCRQA